MEWVIGSSAAARRQARSIGIIANPPRISKRTASSYGIPPGRTASGRSRACGNHLGLVAEVGDRRFRDAEIVGEQVARRFRQPIRQRALLVGAAIEHAD